MKEMLEAIAKQIHEAVPGSVCTFTESKYRPQEHMSWEVSHGARMVSLTYYSAKIELMPELGELIAGYSEELPYPDPNSPGFNVVDHQQYAMEPYSEEWLDEFIADTTDWLSWRS